MPLYPVNTSNKGRWDGDRCTLNNQTAAATLHKVNSDGSQYLERPSHWVPLGNGTWIVGGCLMRERD